MEQIVQVEQYKVTIYQNARKTGKELVIWTHLAEEEAALVWKKLHGSVILMNVSGIDWNRDLSPWPAPKAFSSGEDFSGGAEEYLKLLTGKLLPAAEAELGFFVPSRKRGIAGYSMAGLFAVYAMYHTDAFSLIASMSGSLWYDGWKEYAMTHFLCVRSPRIFLSLGDKEHLVRSMRISRVKECTERLAEYWSRSAQVLYEINQGGHFSQPLERTVQGIRKLAKMERTETD